MTTPRWRFEPVVNVGNVISIVLMLIAVVSIYVNIREVQIKQDVRLTYLETQISTLQEIGKAVASAQQKISSIEEALRDSMLASKAAVDALNTIKVDIGIIKALYQNQVEQPPRAP